MDSLYAYGRVNEGKLQNKCPSLALLDWRMNTEETCVSDS